MKDRALLNTQRKDLHEALIKIGIDPATTRWTNEQKGWTSEQVDTLHAGLCHFLFCPGHDGTYSVHFRPGVDGGAQVGEVNLTWQEVKGLFAIWVRFAKSELEQNDPWRQYSAYVPPERLGASKDNSPFTYQEAEHLTQALRSFRQQLVRQLPNYKEVEKQFEPQLDRLADRARTGAGRIDWSNQFVGMLISLCLALSLAPEEASSLWRFWLQVVDGIFLP